MIVLLSGSFEAGRWTQRAANRDDAIREKSSEVSSGQRRNESTDEVDLTRVKIANVANVGFEEVYYMLRSASPQLRLQWVRDLNALPPGPQRTAALGSFYKTFVQIDPAAASASVDMLGDIDTKLIAAAAMTATAPVSGLSDVAAMLLKLPRERVSTHSWDYLTDVFQEWSAADPEAVARFFDSHPKGELTDYDSTLVYNWARVDPDSARTWLERQDPPIDSPYTFDSLLGGWFEKDPAGAENYLIAHGGEKKMQEAIRNVASELFFKSRADANGFVNRLPDDNSKKRALEAIAESSHSWSTDSNPSPAEVADWMLAFPRQLRAKAMTAVLEEWKDKNMQGLNLWLSQLPPAVRDRVALDWCYNFGTYDEEYIVPLVMGVSNRSGRDAALQDFLSKWLPQKSEKAVQTIRDSQLTDAQKKYLTRLFAEMRNSSPSAVGKPENENGR